MVNRSTTFEILSLLIGEFPFDLAAPLAQPERYLFPVHHHRIHVGANLPLGAGSPAAFCTRFEKRVDNTEATVELVFGDIERRGVGGGVAWQPRRFSR